MLDEWGTMGRKRPTVRDVLDLCLQVEAYTAASYIQVRKSKLQFYPVAMADLGFSILSCYAALTQWEQTEKKIGNFKLVIRT